MLVLHASNIKKSYGDRVIVQFDDLKIYYGDKIGIVGANDKTGKEYARRNLKYITHDVEEMLLANPLLFKTPLVRCGAKATVGYRPEVW